MKKRCQVGNHEVEGDLYLCHHCDYTCCMEHMGNPDAPDGDFVACSNHVEEVRQEQEAESVERQRRQADFSKAVCEDLYSKLREGTIANHALYELLSGEVQQLLKSGTAQALEDALMMTCVALDKTPLEVLVTIHEFLQNHTSMVERNQ